MRRVLTLGAALWLLLVPAVGRPAGAALGDADHQPPPPQTDLDGDGIAEDLEARLADAAPDERLPILVSHEPNVDADTLARAAGGLEQLHRFGIVDGFAATATPGRVRSLARHPQVRRVELNGTVRATLDAATDDFGSDRAGWVFGVDGAGVGICVVDTGVDPGHEQLDGRAPIPFFDAVHGRTTAYDDHGHGTHVAAIAAGDGTGGADAARYAGVAPAAAVYAAKVLDQNGSGSNADVIDGVQWCAAQPGVAVISMSLGSDGASDGTDLLSQAVDAAEAGGDVVVVAAGNAGDAPGTVGSPGAARGAVTVGALAPWSAPSGSRGAHGVYLAAFSSRGPTADGRIKPDLAAPGVRIMAAQAGTTSGYVAYSGTSMATPFVSGGAALLLDAVPALAPGEVRGRLEGSAQARGPAGRDSDWGAGALDVPSALADALGASWISPSDYPRVRRTSGIVADHGSWSWTFEVDSGSLDIPIAVAVAIDGALACALQLGPNCWRWEWSPDLDAELTDPIGTVLSTSICPASNDPADAEPRCGAGRQELLYAMPTVAGTYTVTVWPFSDSPNDGKGGSFAVEASAGPLGDGLMRPTQAWHLSRPSAPCTWATSTRPRTGAGRPGPPASRPPSWTRTAVPSRGRRS
ncbi:MAG TPA: S8 family peptidase [Nitriliruptorales bacterium]|nr:S8 family peptidase [Nitriliruptorales bacterium]